jgi:hypothetical protein
MHYSRVAATAAATIGLALASVTVASAAAAPAQPYVTLPSMLVTNVGQHPQLVGQYGNKGGTTLNDVSFSCELAKSDGSVNPLQELVSPPFTNPFIPGQNANFQFDGTAFKVGHGTQVQCTITGIESGTGRVLSAVSNPATIQVNP